MQLVSFKNLLLQTILGFLLTFLLKQFGYTPPKDVNQENTSLVV
jgi:hypothetical protein